MPEEILRAAISRIDSLNHYYTVLREKIKQEFSETSNPYRFAYLVELYLTFYTCRETLSPKMKKLYDSAAKIVEEYIEIHHVQNGNDGYVQYSIKNTDVLLAKGYELDIKKSSDKYKQIIEMPEIHGANTLIMLITRFEEYISSILHYIYGQVPAKYIANQSVSYSEIEAKGIDDIREYIINREVEEKMRDSYEKWFDIFREHNMKFDSCEEELLKLKESYARRNILVHNSGRVNSTYVSNIKNSDFIIGEKLRVDDEYLSQAFSSIKIIMVSIFIEMIRIVPKNQRSHVTIEVFKMMFDALCEKEYDVACKVFKKLMDNPCLDSEYKLMSKINYWIAKKEIEGLNCIKEEVETLDTSILGNRFCLAKMLILEDNEDVNVLIASMLKSEELFPYMIEEWPLFLHYRATDLYEQLKDKHSELFKIETLEIPNDCADESNTDSIVAKNSEKETELVPI